MDLRERLRLAGVEQQDLARRAGISDAHVSRALRGQRTLKQPVLEAAEVLIRERVALAAQALVDGKDNPG